MLVVCGDGQFQQFGGGGGVAKKFRWQGGKKYGEGGMVNNFGGYQKIGGWQKIGAGCSK